MENKRLLIFTSGLRNGGLERIGAAVANYFAAQGWQVVIVAFMQRKVDPNFFSVGKSIKVVYFPKPYNPIENKVRSIPTWVRMTRRMTKAFNPDCILCMTFKIGSIVSFAAPKFASKVVVREINDPNGPGKSPRVKKLTEFLCRNVKGFLFQTSYEKSCYSEKIQKRGHVIPNPVTIDLSNKWKLNNNNFISYSRLCFLQKRLDVLLDGFDIVRRSYPEIKLDIYGTGSSDDIARLESMIKEKDLMNNVFYNGSTKEIASKILSSRAFVMTSDFEGMSNALLESYCLGIPVITSDWPGYDSVVTDGFDGLVFKRGDAEELAEKIKQLYTDDNLCKRLSQNALSKAGRFDFDLVMESYFDFISIKNN